MNDSGNDVEKQMEEEIEKKVTEFRRWMVADMKLLENDNYTGFIAQLDKYWNKLFADPIKVETQLGKVEIQPQRTNNILEQFFRSEKRRMRKKSGTSSLSKRLKTILADTPFVKNLENPDYMKIILNGSETLAERFSKIDPRFVYQELEKDQKSQEKTIPEMRKLISSLNLPALMAAKARE